MEEKAFGVFSKFSEATEEVQRLTTENGKLKNSLLEIQKKNQTLATDIYRKPLNQNRNSYESVYRGKNDSGGNYVGNSGQRKDSGSSASSSSSSSNNHHGTDTYGNNSYSNNNCITDNSNDHGNDYNHDSNTPKISCTTGISTDKGTFHLRQDIFYSLQDAKILKTMTLKRTDDTVLLSYTTIVNGKKVYHIAMVS